MKYTIGRCQRTLRRRFNPSALHELLGVSWKRVWAYEAASGRRLMPLTAGAKNLEQGKRSW